MTPPLKNLLCLDLYAASRAIIKAYRPYLDELGLTYPQFLVMLALWEAGPLGVKDLSERLSLDSGTLSPLIQRLESAKLVRRRRSKEDEREVRVELTDSGRELQPRAAGIFEQIGCRLAMTREEIEALQATLRTLVAHVEASEPTESAGPDVVKT